MAVTDTFGAYEWIAKREDGQILQADAYKAVASLAVLCSYFEEEYSGNGGGKKALRECADRAAMRGSMPDALKEALAFWITRYVEAGNVNYRFTNTMNWRPGDDVPTATAVLTGKSTDLSDQFMALLTIAYRLRNNLFHGLKGLGELNDQRENLSVACHVLAGVMEFI